MLLARVSNGWYAWASKKWGKQTAVSVNFYAINLINSNLWIISYVESKSEVILYFQVILPWINCI